MESICEDSVVTEEKNNIYFPILRSGEWSDIGHRHFMEDTHICIPDLAKSFSSKLPGEESVSLYGVSFFSGIDNAELCVPVLQNVKS